MLPGDGAFAQHAGQLVFPLMEGRSKMGKPKVSRETLKQLKKKGMSERAIAKQVGMSQSNVHKMLTTPEPTKPKKVKPTRQQLLDRVKWGWTQEEIGQEFGFSQGAISQQMAAERIRPNHFTSTGQHGGSNKQVRCTCFKKRGHQRDCPVWQAARNK